MILGNISIMMCLQNDVLTNNEKENGGLNMRIIKKQMVIMVAHNRKIYYNVLVDNSFK